MLDAQISVLVHAYDVSDRGHAQYVLFLDALAHLQCPGEVNAKARVSLCAFQAGV